MSAVLNMDPISAFADAIRSAGLEPPEQVIADGALHRFPTNGKRGDDSGWYVFHDDGLPAGSFGDWRSGIRGTWCAKTDREFTPAEKREYGRRMEAQRRAREAEEQRRHSEAAEKAAGIWAEAKPGEHEYLNRKGIEAHGTRVHKDGRLVVPMLDVSTVKLASLQFIDADGGKKFLFGGKVSGCYYGIGKPLDGVLCIAEGFATGSTIHEATGHAVAVAFNAGNLRPVATALREKFPEHKFIICADNDTKTDGNPGVTKATEAAQAIGAYLAVPQFDGDGTDFNDTKQLQGTDAVKACIEASRMKLAIADPSVSSVSSQNRDSEIWPEPSPLPTGLPGVEPFDYELLTPPLRRRVEDISERMQCPPDFPAVALIVTLSSVVGKRAGIAPKEHDDWTVIPNLWGGIVGRPGVMKSPALTEVMRPLRRLEAKAVDTFDDAQAEYSASKLVRDQAQSVTKDRVKKLLKEDKRAAAESVARDLVDEEREAPTCRRYLVNDPTVEKLGEILNENPQGVLLFRDELNGFFRNLDKAGRESDRAFYLECWNGDGGFTYDRIGRGTLHIESACLSILGGIQPGPLSDLVRNVAGAGDDGLLQRFQLLVWPDPSPAWRNVDRQPDLDAKREVDATIDRLDRISGEGMPVYRFSPEAQELFNAWRAPLEIRLRDGSLHPLLEAHLSKYRSLVPSLALILYLTEHYSGQVDLLSLERAIAWSVYLESHAGRVYAPALSPDVDSAIALSRHIKAGDVADGFALRDVYRSGWSGLATKDQALAAVSVLQDFDWLREATIETPGRFRTEYRINPALLGDAK